MTKDVMQDDGDGGGAPAVQALVEGAQTLAAKLPRGIRRLSLRAGEHAVEVEWEIAPAGAAVGAAAAAPAGPADVPLDEDEGHHAVLAPLVGTFYTAPEPGADPFVAEGDVVEAGQDIGIVEAMKIMNRISADVAGTVHRILVADGEMVEFGQPLLVIDVS
jgi:acetyl-CoA carboxylase biotin carboxyl carrier protein